MIERKLVEVTINDHRLTRPVPPEIAVASLTGRRVRAVTRRGKYLTFELDHELSWLVHLRMTGSFSALRADAVEPAEREPHRRAAVLLDDRLIVAYNDVRRFGTWAVLEREERDTYFAKRLGPEPLESGFDASWLSERLAGSRAAIKAALLDQRTVAGVGNIYADEALWRARVHPQRVASSMRAPRSKPWSAPFAMR